VTSILSPGGRILAYVVGLEKYGRHTGIGSVDYARNDAEAFENALQSAFPGRTIESELRTDEEATLSTLRYELPQTIAGLREDDLFVFYYAGHGFFGAGGNRLTAFDSNVKNLEGTTWLLSELLTGPLSQSPCRRALIFVDACAEKLSVPRRSVVTPLGEAEFAQFVTQASYHAVFLSCEPGQKSFPSVEFEHGIWTHYLLTALRGEAEEALGPKRYLTGTGLQDYLRKVVPARAKAENHGSPQHPWAMIGGSGSFAIREVPVGQGDAGQITHRPKVSKGKDLIAIGPNVVAVGDILGADGNEWAIELDEFIVGDWLALSRFVDGFDGIADRHRYILINAMGEGRSIAAPPSWKKAENGKLNFACKVSPPAPRMNAHQLPSTMEESPEGDVFARNGSIARTSGLASLPQVLKSTMSLIRGEAVIDLDEGAIFSDYYASFRNSPWLGRLFKLEAIRLASIARQPAMGKSETTPLLCVDLVHGIKLLDEAPQNRRMRVRLDLKISGLGGWSDEIRILIVDEEELHECRARAAASHRLFQPTVNLGKVEPIPASLHPAILR
jgi:Caspase domain